MDGGTTHICIRLAAADGAALASLCAVLSGLGGGAAPERLDPARAALCWRGGAYDLRDGAARARWALAQLRRTGIAGCRAGVGPQRVLAVLGADLAEPEGVLALTQADVPGTLWPLPVGRLWGVGGATAADLRRQGILTVGDLVAAGPGWLRARFGSRALALWSAALGRDHLPEATPGRRGA
jgi:hypothetical protein